MTTNAITGSTATATFPDATTSTNVVPLRTSTQSTAPTEVPAANLSARDKAFLSVANYVESSQKRIAAYDEERKGYLAALAKPMPEPPMKMSEAEWTDFMGLKANALACWNNGSNDCGGKNNREANAINQMDNTLTTNGKWQTLEGAKAMIALANTNGLQSSGGSFEDGAWQSAFNSVRSYSVAAQTEHEGKVAAWKQEQATAKAGLANVTALMGTTDSNMSSTVVAFNDMDQRFAADNMRSIVDRVENMQTNPTSKTDKKDDAEIDSITVTVNAPNKAKPKTNSSGQSVNVKVAVNVDKDFTAANLNNARPINVSSRFGQG